MITILEQLKEQAHFTQTEKRIADYILQHLDAIPAIYIEDLAKATYSSHSAIIRLCKKLDVSGFREFKIAISSIVHSQLHVAGEVNANFPFDEKDSSLIIAKKMADLTMDTVQKTFLQLDETTLDQIVSQLASANRVFLFARGDSQIRARGFQAKLVKLNRFFILAEDYADPYWNAASLSSDDCALFISYSGIVAQYQPIIEHFHKEHVPAILLTGNRHSELRPFASTTLVTSQEEYGFEKISTFSSQIAFDYLLNTIFSALYAKEYQKNILNLKTKQELFRHNLLSDESLKIDD